MTHCQRGGARRPPRTPRRTGTRAWPQAARRCDASRHRAEETLLPPPTRPGTRSLSPSLPEVVPPDVIVRGPGSRRHTARVDCERFWGGNDCSYTCMQGTRPATPLRHGPGGCGEHLTFVSLLPSTTLRTGVVLRPLFLWFAARDSETLYRQSVDRWQTGRAHTRTRASGRDLRRHTLPVTTFQHLYVGARGPAYFASRRGPRLLPPACEPAEGNGPRFYHQLVFAAMQPRRTVLRRRLPV